MPGVIVYLSEIDESLYLPKPVGVAIDSGGRRSHTTVGGPVLGLSRYELQDPVVLSVADLCECWTVEHVLDLLVRRGRARELD